VRKISEIGNSTLILKNQNRFHDFLKKIHRRLIEAIKAPAD